MSDAVYERKPFYRKPLFIVAAIGILIRLICAPLLTYDYDMYHWAVVVQNINSGNALYQLTGYFYTPVWGYMIGFWDMIWSHLASIDVLGLFSTKFIPIEHLPHQWHMAVITSPAFNVVMKIPLIICDVIVGVLIHKVVMAMTNNKRKSDIAFGLWFLCPIVLYMTGIQGMFDCIAALIILLCVILLMKDYYFIAGLLFSAAVLLKLFPGAMILVLALYVLMKYNFKKEGVQKLGIAVAGCVISAVVIMLPNILQGNIDYTLTFLSDRSGKAGIGMVLQLAAVAILEIFVAYRFAVSGKENLNKNLIKYSLFAMIASFLLGINPQYTIIIMPFLILMIAVSDRGYTICWWLVGIGAMMSAFIQNNVGLLASISLFQNLVPIDWILSVMQAIETRIGDTTVMSIINMIFMNIEFIGLAMAFIFVLEEPLGKRFGIVKKYFALLRRIGKMKVMEDA